MSESSTANGPRILEAARRRAWLVVLCVILAGAAAYLYAERQDKLYTAKASLLFQQADFSQQLFGYSASQVVDPTTEQATSVSLASEPVISLLTARKLGGTVSFKDVSDAVTVQAENEGNVIDVEATTSSPALSAQMANAYATQVVKYLQQSNETQVNQAVAALRHQIAALPPHSSELPQLSERLSELQALASLETPGVQVVGEALVPSTPSSPRIARDIALGAAVGLLIGLFGAVLLERRDKRIRDLEEAETELGVVPVLGVLPLVRRAARDRVTVGSEASWFSEAFRLLRAQLRYFDVDGGVRSVLVTSPSPGDGKSTVAWNLATTYAMADPKSSVLVVDADLRSANLAGLAGVANRPGLSEVLSGSAVFGHAVVRVPATSPKDAGSAAYLHVLVSGGPPPNPSQLLESAAFAEMLETAQERFDFVVIDTAPLAQVADSIPALRLVTGVLVVVRLKRTQRAALRALITQLRQLGAPILGAVVNGLADDTPAYGGGKYTSRGSTPVTSRGMIYLTGPRDRDVDPSRH